MSNDKITAREMADKLNGRKIGKEITNEECALAKENGLLVVFGYSDDNMELRGVIYDELSCYEGKDFGFIKACWCEHEDKNISWHYETPFKHSTFNILEDGETWCVGVVIDLSSILNKGGEK